MSQGDVHRESLFTFIKAQIVDFFDIISYGITLPNFVK